MPLGKYYCDYCYKDTPFTRKRHLQASQHQRAKSLWFLFWSALLVLLLLSLTYYFNPFQHQSLIQNHPGKDYAIDSYLRYSLNLHFKHYHCTLKTADCSGLTCYYFYFLYGSNLFSDLKYQGSCPYGDSCNPKQYVDANPQNIAGETVRDGMGNSLENLRPSLKPPPKGGYLPLPFIDWG